MKNNLFDAIPACLPEELINTLAEGRGFRLQRIVSHGHHTPEGEWYDQDEDEWVVLLSGQAVLVIEERAEPIALQPGDYLLLPAHCRHRVAWTDRDQTTVWLALYFSPAESCH